MQIRNKVASGLKRAAIQAMGAGLACGVVSLGHATTFFSNTADQLTGGVTRGAIHRHVGAHGRRCAAVQ